jgi:DNA mismatch endonuclease (patch repair protein)
MPDVFTKAKRSEVMSRIRSKGNANTELRLLAILRLAGITGWRRHVDLAGKPDFVFRKERLAVFVDGCFWHGCPRCYRRPTSNRRYWDAKVVRNRARDRAVTRTLRSIGWRVLRIWEHDLAKQSKSCAQRLREAIHSAPAEVPGGWIPHARLRAVT